MGVGATDQGPCDECATTGLEVKFDADADTEQRVTRVAALLGALADEPGLEQMSESWQAMARQVMADYGDTIAEGE